MDSFAREAPHTFGRSASTLLLGRGFACASGCNLWDEEGKEYLDFTAGVGVMSTGHQHPIVAGAIRRQLERMIAYHDAPSRARADLYERLAALLPGYRFALFSGGSETVEAAMRVTEAYTGKKFSPDGVGTFGLRDSFHGKTLGARATACCKFPKDVGELERVGSYTYFREGYGGAIVELVQGTAGNVIVPEGFLRALYQWCKDNGALFIVDEILTGCGRTGKMFAFQHYPWLVPDILLLGKGIGSGFPVGVLAVREAIATDPRVDTPSAFSTSFGGNALACAAANATLQVIKEEGLVARSAEMGEYLLECLRQRFRGFDKMVGLRGLGLMVGLDLASAEYAEEAVRMARNQGLLLMRAKSSLRINPPLIITREQVDSGTAILRRSLS